jgi:hypothetical protein
MYGELPGKGEVQMTTRFFNGIWPWADHVMDSSVGCSLRLAFLPHRMEEGSSHILEEHRWGWVPSVTKDPGLTVNSCPNSVRVSSERRGQQLIKTWGLQIHFEATFSLLLQALSAQNPLASRFLACFKGTLILAMAGPDHPMRSQDP